jgi:exosortase/archaeosortase family protein
MGIVYLLLRLLIFDEDPLIPLLNSLYYTYLLVPEWVADGLFSILNAGVTIEDHRLVYDNIGIYQESYAIFIDAWPKYLLHKRWVLLILLVIWINFSPVKRKMLFSGAFIIVHIVAVVAGLYLMGVLGPNIVDESTKYFLSPTLAGNMLLFSFLLFWVFFNKGEIRNTFSILGINGTISDSRINETLAALFFLFILRDFFIPYFEYKPYVAFLLEITQMISFSFGFEGVIIGDHLVGANGALALAKYCLGFMTMYVFGSLIFLTRPNSYQIKTWLFIGVGMVVIFLSNIVRLVLVFIIAQGENGYNRASLHHEIYNVGIYIFIFVLWVIWVEKIRNRTNSIKKSKL